MLPGLDALGLPIPLGGTSNHFRTEMLRELGGWDPYNVTEDADLGIRASALRSRVAVINSTTYEEANGAYGNWIRQRSRWIKGYMQTVLVRTRHPLRLVSAVGLRQALGFALLIGGTPLSFLAGPPLWALLAVTLARPSLLAGLTPHWVQVSNMVSLFAGNAAIAYLNMLAVFKRRRYRLIWFALLNPLYWVMHSLASFKALWQLASGKAFFWEKTVHGLTAADPDPDPDVSVAGAPMAGAGR
jgi:cellulose synthase/poly-beta-1,6-N-acetylglucosamine synthase-like glycosyltransferase